MFKNKLLLINIVLFVIIVFLAIYFFVFNKNIVFQREKSYYAVYLKTGDLYFGELSRFGGYKLSNVFFLQRDQSGQLSIQKFEQSVFQPEDKIELNKENIVWVAKIKKGSPLISFFEGRQNQSLNPPSAISTTSTKEK